MGRGGGAGLAPVPCPSGDFSQRWVGGRGGFTEEL